MSITLKDVAGISSAIATIRTNSAEVQVLIHETAVSVLAHVRDHGDTTLAVRLANACSSGVRREGLAAWFLKFSGNQMRMTFKDGSCVCALKAGWTKDLFDVEGSMAVDFGDLTKEKSQEKALDLAKLIAAIKKFTTNDKKLADGSPVVPAEVVAAAQKALKALTA
jgi:hypothetical protein